MTEVRKPTPSKQKLKPGTKAFMEARAKALEGYSDVCRHVGKLHLANAFVAHSADPEGHGSSKRISADGL